MYGSKINILMRDHISSLRGLLAGVMMMCLFLYMTSYDAILGNSGVYMYHIWIVCDILVSILFAIFVKITLSKLRLYSISPKSDKSKNSSRYGALGSFFGILVTGCPSCTISIATYIGLSSVFALLPYHGIELKLLSIGLLVYSIYAGYTDLLVCKK